MRRVIFSLVGLGLLGLSACAKQTSTFSEAETQSGVQKIVSIQLNDFKQDMAYLTERHVDIAGVNLDKNLVDIVVTGEEFKGVTTLMPFKVVQAKTVSNASPDSEYYNLEKITAKLQSTVAQFGNIAKLEEIGKSLEGRSMWAIKISDNVETREYNEPVMYFNAMHHSREVMTAEVAMDMVDYLTTRYGTDERVTNWVNNTEIWIVPMVNPDGNHKVWHGSSMWRKNTRDNVGVDINRNYPYSWGRCRGSSDNPSQDDYRGASPGSEPETQVIMNFVGRIKPVFSISYHSYSEVVLLPFGCKGVRVVNRSLIENLGKEIADQLPLDESPNRRYRSGAIWEVLYSADGGDVDWLHEIHQVIPYVIELNSQSQGFQPSYSSWRNKTVEKARKSWMLLMDRVLKSGVRGQIRLNGEPVKPGVRVSVSSVDKPELSAVVYKTAADGTFHIALEPGDYNLSIISPVQGREVIHPIKIGADLLFHDVDL